MALLMVIAPNRRKVRSVTCHPAGVFVIDNTDLTIISPFFQQFSSFSSSDNSGSLKLCRGGVRGGYFFQFLSQGNLEKFLLNLRKAAILF